MDGCVLQKQATRETGFLKRQDPIMREPGILRRLDFSKEHESKSLLLAVEGMAAVSRKATV
ncbi:hypothetical protein TSUD_53320 [Trifolium subterraneum]|uniref:Uncharacterized protein n=1 Tax=Trifolium subterraneum TaxID=3900 RepID=A0A2Z6N0X1_TRISU|nr:hypothetical protein TSUD_53320 [Trifolium subterraneum]